MAPLNASDVYFGTYARFATTNKRKGAALAGPDNAVGDIGEIEWRLDDHQNQQAWLKNPYGQAFAFLDHPTSYKLAILDAKGWIVKYVLSFVAYSESLGDEAYWGQAAIIAYPPRYAEQFDRFVKAFAKEAERGSRPDPSLSENSIENVLEDPASWGISKRIKIPREEGKTVILKDHRSMHDKLLDQGRSKNPGCYLVSWAFIAALAAFAAWLLHIMGII